MADVCVGRPRDDSSVDMSDHEEEFYYTEVEEEENVDTVTQTFADMQTTSPTRALTQLSDVNAALPDHDYQRKVLHTTSSPVLSSLFRGAWSDDPPLVRW